MNELLPYVLPVLAYLLVFGAFVAWRQVAPSITAWLNVHVAMQTQETLYSLAGNAVLAIEQAAASSTGQEKKRAALALVDQALAAHGITAVTAEMVDAAVEAAVHTELLHKP